MACNRCRAKKRKCIYNEGTSVCVSCAQAHTECTRVPEPKPYPRVRQHKGIAALHERLRQLEDLVKRPQSPDLVPDATVVEPVVGVSFGGSLSGNEKLVTSSDSHGSTIDPTRAEDLIDIAETVSSNVGDDPAHGDSREDIDEEGDFDGATFLLRLPVVLPPAPQAWSLLQEYLVDFNKAVPLFSQERLIDLYRDAFASAPKLDCLQLKAIYSTLAIAFRLRAMSPLASDSDNHNAKSFIMQTSVALPRVLIARPSLPSAQFLVGMAVVMHGTHNAQGTRNILAAALRVLMDLKPRSFEYDRDQTSRVFWIASFIDLDLAIRNGQWLSAVYDPPNNFDFGWQSVEAGILPLGHQLFPIFLRRGQLAKIQIRLLHAVGAAKPGEAASDSATYQRWSASLNSVAADLVSWRLTESLFQIQPEVYRHKLHRSDLVHLLVLEATYFNTLFVLQGSIQNIGPFQDSIMFHLHKYSQLDFWGYLGEALRFLNLFNYLQHGDVAFVWLVIETVACAAFVLLNAALQRPPTLSASDDLEVTTEPLRLLRELAQKHPQTRLNSASEELERLHQEAIVLPGDPTVK